MSLIEEIICGPMFRGTTNKEHDHHLSIHLSSLSDVHLSTITEAVAHPHPVGPGDLI